MDCLMILGRIFILRPRVKRILDYCDSIISSLCTYTWIDSSLFHMLAYK